MPPSLPREILDLIIDNLHDDLNTLKMCCLVSKAWVYQTRTHLFNRVHFQNYGGQNIWQWGNTFPDPLNSPAHYTRIISIDFSTRPSVGMAHVLLTFRCVTHLNIHIPYWFFLVPLHQFSPVVGSLRLSFHDFPASEIFDFIRSFPLLEDLSLAHRIELDRNWNPPSTTPILTGSLELKLVGISDMVHQLLDLPNGLHFKRIAVLWTMEEDVRPTMDLVSRCSKTLESLEITGDLTDEEAPGIPPSDLSKAIKLRDLVLVCRAADVEWIVAVLCAAQITTLQTISLVVSLEPAIRGTTLEGRGWQTIDNLLIQFWISHSIRPKVLCEWVRSDWPGCMEKLLPESMKKGIVDMVECGSPGGFN